MGSALKGIPCFGEKIARARRDRPASQHEVGIAVGVNRETVSGWEKPGIKGIRPSHFRKIVEFLSINPEQIRAPDGSYTAKPRAKGKSVKVPAGSVAVIVSADDYEAIRQHGETLIKPRTPEDLFHDLAITYSRRRTFSIEHEASGQSNPAAKGSQVHPRKKVAHTQK
jgi:transcriptional regulator with XRE-family HTH domain